MRILQPELNALKERLSIEFSINIAELLNDDNSSESENESEEASADHFEGEKKEEAPSIKVGKMSEALAWMVLKCLAETLHFMHQKGVEYLSFSATGTLQLVSIS